MSTMNNNEWLLWAESMILNHPRCIEAENVAELMGYGVCETDAVGLLLAGLLGLDTEHSERDRNRYNNYLRPSLKKLDHSLFDSNPYLQEIRWHNTRNDTIELTTLHYEPYELMPCGDTVFDINQRLNAPIGFFDQRWSYPALLENGRIWMSVTPNEIITMQRGIERVHGDVVVLGMGMGYYAMQAARKAEVSRVRIVELNTKIIESVGSMVLPQCKGWEKMEVIQADAMDYMAQGGRADYIYADLWHDVGDGLEIYKHLKGLEPLWEGAECDYWIEDSMLCYMA